MKIAETFETMIAHVIDTFRNSTTAVNQAFVRNGQLRQVPVIVSHTH